MACFKTTAVIFYSLLTLSGCAANRTINHDDLATREAILLKSGNYSGLITLYRNCLQARDTPEARLKLSHYYYEIGDYSSSLLYLRPLFNSNKPKVALLEVKNRIALGEQARAISITDRLLTHFPRSAEAYNLRGIALALSGDSKSGMRAIETSRELFIADDVAINNLATIALLDRRYQDAVNLLLPQYMRGQREPHLVHNLVIALVKTGDSLNARNIIKNESLSDTPDALINVLDQLTPIQQDAV